MKSSRRAVKILVDGEDEAGVDDDDTGVDSSVVKVKTRKEVKKKMSKRDASEDASQSAGKAKKLRGTKKIQVELE